MNGTRFADSSDGTKIAFDVSGEGAALILLHGGFVHTRRSWHDTGYVNRLATDFRVIAVDLRGHGESNAPTNADSYTTSLLVADILAVADACRADRFSVWGYSLGATLALYVASMTDRVRRAVIAGSYFGPLFTKEQVD